MYSLSYLFKIDVEEFFPVIDCVDPSICKPLVKLVFHLWCIINIYHRVHVKRKGHARVA